MGILEKLLECDKEVLQKKEKKEFEIKRLSEKLGEPFVVTIHALTNEQVEHVAEISKTSGEMRENVILESVRIEGKKIGDKDFAEKFGCHSRKEAVEKIFLPGEIYGLYEEINELSGYGKDAVKEVKN